jgi:hypothetical protein
MCHPPVKTQTAQPKLNKKSMKQKMEIFSCSNKPAVISPIRYALTRVPRIVFTYRAPVFGLNEENILRVRLQ